MNLDKWTSLIQQVNVVFDVSDHLLTLSENQLHEFESYSKIKLPLGYKEFCQIFGSGSFSCTFFSISTPGSQDFEETLISNSEIIFSYKSSYALRHGYDYSDPDSIPENIRTLLDSFYIFGYGEGGVCFAFDLRTYSDIDCSCDIFGFDWDDNFVDLGRDFFKFIRNICIGSEAEEICPALLAGVPSNVPEDSLQNSRNTFFV
jgi:SMI1 / KNR4 family (SUKH-1)